MDDISESLKDMAHIIDIAQGRAEVIMTSGSMLDEAHLEIERLRKALYPILDAYAKPGNFPGYHDYLKTGLKKEWRTLSTAIEDAIAVTGYGKE